MATTATTVAGLLSLAISPLAPLRTFGLFGSLAVVLSTLMTFTLVPSLLVILRPKIPPQAARLTVSRSEHITRLLLWAQRVGHWRVLLCALAVAVISAVAAAALRVEDSWIANLPASSDVVRGDRRMNEHLAGTTALQMDVRMELGESFWSQRSLTQLATAEERLKRLPEAGAVTSPYTDVVRIAAALRGSAMTEYRDSLRRGLTALSDGEAAQALSLAAAYHRGSLGASIDESSQHARVTVYMPSASYATLDHVVREARALFPSDAEGRPTLTFFGDAWISYVTVRLLVDSQLRSIAAALLSDLILAWLLLRSFRMALVAIAPVALSVLVLFAALAAAGRPLGIASSMFAAVALGLGMDYALHLGVGYADALRRTPEPFQAMLSALAATGPAILISAYTIGAGCAVLSLSQIAPNALLGCLIALSLAVCCAATLILMPSLALTVRAP
jgi:predicted RND superfamily exporter protein